MTNGKLADPPNFLEPEIQPYNDIDGPYKFKERAI